MVLAPLSSGFQSLPPLPTIKLGPSGADSQVGGLVHAPSPCGSLQRPLSPVRLGVSPAAASTPTGVFNQRFEALFRRAGALGCVVCFAPPPFLPVYLCANVGPQGLLAAALPDLFHNLPPHWLREPLPCHKFSPPGCPSPPLLPVWMNVSPWLSDFHTV